jgi:TonB-dependent receptor
MKRWFVYLGALLIAALPVSRADAQGATGSIAGRIADTARAGLAASLRVLGPGAHGAYADADGAYTIADMPAGGYRVEVRFPGFRTDTFDVSVVAGQTTRHNVVMHPTELRLAKVQVTATGVAETQAYALQVQKTSDNIVNVMSGDEIRSLPNYNAAEAAARLPGVASEHDEGEGKYVEIRGTPPDFQHVTIDGADVPGTLATDVRAVKLDDVPAELLGSVEVSKTLTADQDASAIGGSVNLVSKVPEGAPHGYVTATYGYQEQENNNDGQGGFVFGGRVGEQQKLGFLLSGSYDRIDRTLNDVEPSFTGVAPVPGGGPGSFYAVPNGSSYTHIFPSEWSQREYNYYRTRYGLGGDLDYRISPTATISLKGLWSAFFDEANRWETNFSGDGNNNGADTVINGTPTVTNGKIKNTVANRGPIEHTWGFTSQAKNIIGPMHMSYAINYAGSEATEHDHLEDTYKFSQNGFNYGYNGSNLTPEYVVPNALRSAIASPANYNLSELDTDNEFNSGQDVGARIDALIPYAIGSLPASFKFGVKYRDEHKGYLDYEPQFTTNNPVGMSQFLSSYTVANYYQHICGGCYTLAPFASIPAVESYYHANPSNFAGISGQTEADNLNSFAGTEQVAAAYAMQTLDVGQMHVNAGLRVENTTQGYLGHVTTGPNDTLAATIQHGNHTYIDFFPSLQLRYGLDENTNLRAVVSRGIARPDYAQLAPFINGVGVSPGEQTPITEGNPALKPEYAWNYDLLGEHFFSSVGVLSGGFFYKDIHDFIFTRLSPYTGTNPNFLNPGGTPFYVSQYQNGPSAELWGVEADYTQHLTFLPGALRGIGFDVNWTHVESRAVVPVDTTLTYSYVDAAGNTHTFQPYHNAVRHAPLDRTIPTLLNLALLYDWSTVSARVAGQYTAATINAYGIDGSSNPVSSDNYFYPHWQIDAELTWRVYGSTAITVAGQNINNEYFGFFTGTPGDRQNNQRETYGSVWLIGLRQGF